MSAIDGAWEGLLGPAFQGLIPTSSLPARNGGSWRDPLLGNCSGAVSVQFLPRCILCWSSRCRTGRTGKLQEPKHQPLSHADPVFREHRASLRHMVMLCAQVKIKAKPVGLGDVTREAKYSGGFGSWSHSFKFKARQHLGAAHAVPAR